MGTESHGSQKPFLTQLLDSCDASFTILILTGSRAAEGDIVKVTGGNARLFVSGLLDEDRRRLTAMTRKIVMFSIVLTALLFWISVACAQTAINRRIR
jgi:hypothetical protein